MRKAVPILTLVAAALLVPALPATASVPRVGLAADLVCGPTAGATVEFTISNTGTEPARLDPDFHLILEVVRGGRQPGVVLFVFPAPGFDIIPVGQNRTFVLDMGLPDESFEGTDLTGARLLLEAEVWLAGRTHPVVRTFTFAGCG